jgi:hypothetical protein
MNKKDFVKKSQDFLSQLFFKSSFDLDNRDRLGIIEEPVTLDDVKLSIYYSRILTGYKPVKTKDMPLLYTFAILVPPKNIKKRFIKEVKKMESDKKYNKKVIGKFYELVAPGKADFQEVVNDLKRIFTEIVFNNKYKFGFHLVCPTQKYNFATIFVELNSYKKLDKEYKGKVPFDPIIKK